RAVTDPNFRIFTDRDTITVFNSERFVRGTDIHEIFAQLGVDEASHAFYLGRELMKAKLAITLGKTYRQEGALQWGYLTPPDDRGAGDPLAHVGTLVATHGAAPLAELPPFQGGAAGYVGYDWGMMLERVPRPRYDDLAVPDLLLGLYDWVIAWDHAAGRAWVISTGIPERGMAQERRAAHRLAVLKDRLARPGVGGLPARQKDAVAPGAPPRPARRSA